MIKPEELRIGNWVSFDLHNKQITDFEILEYASRNGKPIDLSPEILEGCGFEKEGLQCDFSNGKMDLDKTDDGFMVSFHGSREGSEFKYLHQLQNTYYWLTQTELPVKLPVTA